MSATLYYQGYYAAIRFEADEAYTFVGKVIGINDLVSFEGNTVTKLTKNFHKAVDKYLETCKKENRDPDKSYSGTFNVRILPLRHKEISLFASENSVSLNLCLCCVIDYALQHKEEIVKLIEKQTEPPYA